MLKALSRFFIALLLISSLNAAGLQLCATTTLVGEMVHTIAGPENTTTTLMGPGVDPHVYKAKASDQVKLLRADIIFYNGLHLEGHLSDLLESFSKRGKCVHALADNIPKTSLFAPEPCLYDPHIWFNPSLWALCTQGIAEKLSQADPKNEAQYHARAKALAAQYKSLEAWANEYLAQNLPKEKRILITSHDAYNYFGKAFDFQVIGIQGISTAAQAGVATINKITQYIKQNCVKAIFVESSVSKATIERVSQDSGAIIGGELFSDALGAAGEMHRGYDVGTYEGMFRYNLTMIVESLKS